MSAIRTISALTLCFCAASCFAEQKPDAAEVVDLSVKKTDAPPDPKIAALISRLGSADTIEREDAEKGLMAIGNAAVPQLKEAEKSANPEIAARARRLGLRLADVAAMPDSYAGILPADSVFYLEVNDVAASREHFNNSLLGKFFQKNTARTWWANYKKGQLDPDLKVLHAFEALPGLLTGKAVLAISSPDTIEADKLDPPFVFAIETKNLQPLEAQIRNMFEGMNDPITGKRPYKKFEIEEQTNAHSVFGQNRFIHALTQKSMEVFLDNLLAPPAKPLSKSLADWKESHPKADYFMHIAADGLKNLGEAYQLLDPDQYEILNAIGFTPGSSYDNATIIAPEGFQETTRLQIAGGKQNAGLLAVLSRMTALQAAPVQANQAQALDLIPHQAAFVASFHGDTSKSGAELIAALRALDKALGQPIHDDKAPDAGIAVVQPPKDPQAPKSRAAEALDAGGGAVAQKNNGDAKKPGPAEDKLLDRTSPYHERFAQTGLTLERLFEHLDGPMYLALFPERVSIARVLKPEDPDAPMDPSEVPMAALVAMYLKEPDAIEAQLMKASVGVKPRYKVQVLNGGKFYFDAEGDENVVEDTEDKAGFWIAGNYLAYGTTRNVLELASAAMLNQNGNERMTARASFQEYLEKTRTSGALLNVYAYSEAFLDMPYKMAQLNYQTDPQNPWPDYSVAGGLLKQAPIRISLKPIPGGLYLQSQTPFTLVGLIQAVRKPLRDAGLIQR